MALKFKKVARKVLNGAEKGSTKYYAVAVASNSMKKKEGAL